jgi:hypothetical protein
MGLAFHFNIRSVVPVETRFPCEAAQSDRRRRGKWRNFVPEPRRCEFCTLELATAGPLHLRYYYAVNRLNFGKKMLFARRILVPVLLNVIFAVGCCNYGSAAPKPKSGTTAYKAFLSSGFKSQGSVAEDKTVIPIYVKVNDQKNNLEFDISAIMLRKQLATTVKTRPGTTFAIVYYEVTNRGKSSDSFTIQPVTIRLGDGTTYFPDEDSARAIDAATYQQYRARYTQLHPLVSRQVACPFLIPDRAITDTTDLIFSNGKDEVAIPIRGRRKLTYFEGYSVPVRLITPLKDGQKYWPIGEGEVKIDPARQQTGLLGFLQSSVRVWQPSLELKAKENDKVITLLAGKMVAIGYNDCDGVYVVIRHVYPDVFTAYGHLNAFTVKVGMPVERGQVIGFVGRTGMADEDVGSITVISPQGQYVEPMAFLEKCAAYSLDPRSKNSGKHFAH